MNKLAPRSQNVLEFLKVSASDPASASQISLDATPSVSIATPSAAPIDIHVQRLIRDATNVDVLASKELSWLPWL